MTPARFRYCLDKIGWSQRRLAKELNVHEMKPRRWANGTTPVPAVVAGWLTLLAPAISAAHRKYPVPILPRFEKQELTPDADCVIVLGRQETEQ